jgi:hypothetical protein
MTELMNNNDLSKQRHALFLTALTTVAAVTLNENTSLFYEIVQTVISQLKETLILFLRKIN